MRLLIYATSNAQNHLHTVTFVITVYYIAVKQHFVFCSTWKYHVPLRYWQSLHRSIWCCGKRIVLFDTPLDGFLGLFDLLVRLLHKALKCSLESMKQLLSRSFKTETSIPQPPRIYPFYILISVADMTSYVIVVVVVLRGSCRGLIKKI